MGGGGGAMRTFVGAIVAVCFLWLLVLQIVSSGGTISRTPTTTTTTTTRASLRSLDVIPRDSNNQHVVHLHNSDLNYMSKRKVPNGPDPIHNRRTGKSGQSPGRA